MMEEKRLLDHDLERGYGTLNEKVEAQKHDSGAFDQPSLVQDWMSLLDDRLLVSSLTIPGTHDSAAYTRPWPYIATQKLSILQQLTAGVRYFDLRCGLQDDVAEMVHGPSLLGLELDTVLTVMYDFLTTHPTEGLIVQIKEDRKPDNSTIRFSQAILQSMAANAEFWRTANTTPTLGELRGKIQLLRRYNVPSFITLGIDVTQWQDNSRVPFTIFTRHQVQVTIQDHYSFPDPTPLPSLIALKGGDVSGLLERASKDPDECHWYMNFTSAYEFNLWYQLTPREIAVGGYYGFSWKDGMNVLLRNYLRIRGDGKQRYGIVAMDFPDLGTDDLIALLIKSNFKRKVKMWPLVLFVVMLWIWICLVLAQDLGWFDGNSRPIDHLMSEG